MQYIHEMVTFFEIHWIMSAMLFLPAYFVLYMLSIYYDGGKAQNGGKLHILFAGVAFATSTGACGFLAAVFLWCLLMFVILAVLVFAARRAFTGFTW